MNFITGLPECNGKNALMVCCDKLGKPSRLIPTWVGEDQLSATKVSKLFLTNWVWHYGIPKQLIHDCDMHFTVLFWYALWAMLGMQNLFITAYHP